MSDYGMPPTPPQDLPPTGAPQGGPQVPQVRPSMPAAAAPVPARRSRAWVWWTLGICLALFLTVGACSMPFLMWKSAGDASFSAMGEGAVAVIRLDGMIVGSGSSFDGYVTPEYFYDLLQQAEEDSQVKAIVLRVDSPGGTVAASEEISRYVKECSKPVIVSVSDVGASGAYMIASQSDEIWAMPGSTVGSIGVISEIPNVGKLLDKVGVEFQVITAGKYKDAGSPYRKLTDDEKALIQGSVDEAYGQFIDIVAEGRKLPRSEVESLATGWAWSGQEALDLKLVDKLGTYQDALDAAAKRGGIAGEYDVIDYDDEFDDLLDSLFSLTGRLGGVDALSGTRDSALEQSLPR